MTAHEALWIIKVQLSKTEQNLQAVKVLEDIVKSIHRVHIDDDEPTYTLDETIDEVFGTEAQHMRNHMEKVGTKDLQDLEKREQTCARYELAEENDDE